MIRIEQRASTVLYKFLVTNCQGRKFVLPANICSIVPLTFLKANIDFEFVDIDPSTHAGSYSGYKQALGRIDNGKRGLLYVNAYGYNRDNYDFYSGIKSLYPDTVIIEDDCLCIPGCAVSKGTQMADLSLFSTGDSKVAPVEGEGGFGIFDDKKWGYSDIDEEYDETAYSLNRKEIRECRKRGIPFSYHDSPWLPLHRTKLKNVSENEYFDMVRKSECRAIEHKSKINRIYDECLPDEVKFSGEYHNWRYMLILPSHEVQQQILDALFDAGLYASAHYAPASFLFKQQHCPLAEKEASLVLNLFNEQKYSEEMARETVIIINKIINKYDKPRGV